MTYDETVDFYMNVHGLDKGEAEHVAVKLTLRDINTRPVYRCPDPEGAYEQMMADTFGNPA